jgi:hypothetical protein
VSYPLASFASGTGWTYTAQNNVASSQTLTSHAYCAKKIKAPKLRTHTLAQTVSFNGSINITTPACESRKTPRMAAGGFNNSSNAGAIPFPIESRYAGPSWKLSVRNVAVDQFFTASVQGICLQP